MIVPRLDVATLHWTSVAGRLAVVPICLLLWRRYPAARSLLAVAIAELMAIFAAMAWLLHAPVWYLLANSAGVALLWVGLCWFEQARLRWWLAGLFAVLPLALYLLLARLGFRGQILAWPAILVWALVALCSAHLLLRRRPISLAQGLAATAIMAFGLSIVIGQLMPGNGFALAELAGKFCGGVASLALLWLAFERTEARLTREALIDPQTGLLNRRGLENIVPQLLGMAQRSRSPVAVLLADLDHFKAINDRHGHRTGDLALQSFVATIGSVLKRQGDFTTRYGGEEFVILLPDTGPAGACAVAERLRQSVAAQPFQLDDVSWNLTVSIGVSVVPPEEHSLQPALARADDALYLAKSRGRNQVAEKLPEGSPAPS